MSFQNNFYLTREAIYPIILTMRFAEGVFSPHRADAVFKRFIPELLEEEVRQRAIRAEEEAESKASHNRERVDRWEGVLQHCRPASIDDYLAWLRGRALKHGTENMVYS